MPIPTVFLHTVAVEHFITKRLVAKAVELLVCCFVMKLDVHELAVFHDSTSTDTLESPASREPSSNLNASRDKSIKRFNRFAGPRSLTKTVISFPVLKDLTLTYFL